MNRMKLSAMLLGIVAIALSSPFGLAAASDESSKKSGEKSGQSMIEEYQGEARDAWLDGKLETAYALDEDLSAWAIGTRVENGVAHLSGNVGNLVDKTLAGQIALTVDGIHKVENNLQVTTTGAEPVQTIEGHTFAQRIEDLRTTARVAKRYIAEPGISGIDINVDTVHEVVTLSGIVESKKQKQLAADLAANTDGVRSVVNQLQVADQ